MNSKEINHLFWQLLFLFGIVPTLILYGIFRFPLLWKTIELSLGLLIVCISAEYLVKEKAE